MCNVDGTLRHLGFLPDSIIPLLVWLNLSLKHFQTNDLPPKNTCNHPDPKTASAWLLDFNKLFLFSFHNFFWSDFFL